MRTRLARLVTVLALAAVGVFGVGQVTGVDAASTQDVVYIATGENFPDALGVGSVAALNNAPVLFVLRDAIPGATLAELNRLQPSTIIIVGGTGVVSDTVKSALEGLSFGPVVERLAGADRFATAAAVSASQFPAELDADTLDGKDSSQFQEWTGTTHIQGADLTNPGFYDDLVTFGVLYSAVDGNFACGTTGVELPDGATITEFSMRVKDSSSTRLTSAFLYAVDNSGVISVLAEMNSGSTAAPGVTTVTDSTIATPVVDLANYVYVVFACANSTLDQTLVSYLDISYTLP